jgi:hypothetical protein
MPEHAEERSWRSMVTPRKLSFYLLFHGFHVALFIIGWCVAIVFSFANMQTDVHQVETTDQQETSTSQSLDVLGMDIERRRTGPECRYHLDHATHVQKSSTLLSTKNQMASFG